MQSSNYLLVFETFTSHIVYMTIECEKIKIYSCVGVCIYDDIFCLGQASTLLEFVKKFI